ncbi:CaiB/BaiF CoA-transferase family protein [Tepidiforma flava]|uniref:CaiB/BaiF CoA-transferase family protein n=1 Tax=Tepidiforma flava TaxID=3004094 RepID=A0ABY7M383_9CHLR|nr:CaiB/BaiF CoA-transferase family protein [Tepidiforma flava]WBL35090.1 CaiB/BaiF CoA-transferase family protein [Tepidiforma flava]
MRGPLEGIRVLDFTWALAGPFATMQLADMGAEVVMVEHPQTHEKERGFGPYYEGISTFFFSPNRGKKGIAVDLKTEAGKEVIRRLAGQADVLVENFRPGTMDRLGLGYAALREVNPRLIYAALSGFGQTGPYSHLPAVDAVAQAMGGTMSLNGYRDGPPLRVGVSIGDMVGGLYLALGILAALRARDVTGEGQLLDVALMEAQMALCENAIVRHSAFGEAPTRQGSRHPLVAPFGPFETKDGWIVIANVKEWELFCALIGRDDLAVDERFATNRGRLEHVEELERELNAALREKTTDEWFAVLEPANVCSIGKVNSIADLFDDPHVAARGMLVDIPLPYGLPGSLKLPNSPIHLSKTPTVVGNPMPEHGGDTDDVLARWIGLSADEIGELRAAGVIK